MRSLCVAALAALSLFVAAPSRAADRPPNVIVFLGDDLGYGELGFQGNREIPTPNLDALAAGGIRFTSGYVSGPYCSPTRCGLITGRYQTRLGHEFNPGQRNGLRTDQTTLADRFKSLGYATCAIGKWHLGQSDEFHPLKRGFDEFYGTLNNTPFFHPQLVDSRVSPTPARVESEDFYTTDAYAERAVDWIEKHRDAPYFLYVPFNAQHAPLQATKKYLDRFPNIADEKRRTFAAMLSAMDDAVGAVTKKVRDLGQEENTIIVFLTDNGGPTPSTTSKNDPLRGVKATTLEGGIRIPFVMQWKGKLPAGGTYDFPIIQLDLAPTLLTAAGATVESSWNFDGVDLLPYLTGVKQGRPHEALYWRFGPQWAIRHGDWKLVASRVDGPDKVLLYNLAEDIGEKNDLAAMMPDKVKELRTAWEAWDAGNAPAAWQAPAGAATPANPNRRRRNQANPANPAAPVAPAAPAAPAKP